MNKTPHAGGIEFMKITIYVIVGWLAVMTIVESTRYFKQQEEIESIIKITSGIIENQRLMQDNTSDIVEILKDITKK